MRRQTRQVTVEVEVDIDVFTMTENERDDLRIEARRIIRVCGLVEQPFDRENVRKIAEGLLETLEELEQ